jgi:hypothetical protein
LQHIQKIRFKGTHLSGSLIILVLRYLQQNYGNPIARAAAAAGAVAL